MDVMTPAQRYKAMAHNRGRTGPERALARSLWHLGLRYLTDEGYYKRYRVRLIGHPDLVFPRKRVVIFVDGCFWHGCRKCGKVPGDMSDSWRVKIQTNVLRDKRMTKELEEVGWTVMRVPEHDVHTKASLRATAEDLFRRLGDARLPSKVGQSSVLIEDRVVD